jgi:glutaminyl-peptide cyclotransferase
MGRFLHVNSVSAFRKVAPGPLPSFVVAAALLSLTLVGCQRQAATKSAQTAAVTTPVATPTGIPTYGVTVVNQYPHDATAFTEGLEWHDGVLYESTGLVGHSDVRRENLSGEILSQVQLPPPYFGEGITIFQGTLYELTWKSGVGFKYDARTLSRRGRFTFTGEGWGMTHDAQSLIMSDGTNVLRYLDPTTLRVERALTVTAQGMEVPRLNELERIHGEIWANVWQVPEIARIDPQTGHVIAWVDIAPLIPALSSGDTVDVANGIAYDSTSDRIFITGKLWPTLYEIRLGARE